MMVVWIVDRVYEIAPSFVGDDRMVDGALAVSRLLLMAMVIGGNRRIEKREKRMFGL